MRWSASKCWGVILLGVSLLMIGSYAAAADFNAANGASVILHGKEERRASIEFSALVRQQEQLPRPAEQRAIHRPQRLPLNPPVSGPVPSQSAPLTSGASATSPATPSPALGTNFVALPDSATVIPPDTQGAVGPEHVMTTLNSQVLIQDRNGQTVMGPVSLATFWSAVGANGPFDPRLIYEPYAKRWIISAADGANTANSRLLVGVSAGPDPTGAWYLFAVKTDATGATWGDYPLIGFNKDWIVLTANTFTVGSAPTFSKQVILVFNKTDLFANVGATHTALSNAAGGLMPALTYDTGSAELYLLQDWNVTQAVTRLYKVSGAVGSESLNYVTTGVGPNGQGYVFYPGGASALPPSSDFLPQLGSTAKIEAGDTRIAGLIYRNGALWAAQTVFLPSTTPNHSAAQWWQMSLSGAVIQYGRIEDASGANSYAFPSIAVNRNSDVTIGYSRFSAAQYVSANFSFRKSTDAAGTMQPETLLKSGEGVYIKTFGYGSNRWGDYSNTVVDPLNDTDFWSIQEYAATPVAPGTNDGNGRWGTWWGFVETPRTASQVALNAQPNDSVFGQSVLFTASVSGAAPTGTVQFKDGANNLGAPASLVNGVATYADATLGIGTHSIRAAYSGDGNNTATISATLNENILPIPAMVVLTTAPTAISFGQTVTMTATVTGTSPSGTVQFLDGAANLGSPVNLVNGVAVYIASALTVGSHALSAVYSGDANNGAAASAGVIEDVVKATSSVGLSATSTTIDPGQQVTFTATVTGVSPTGTVQFKDGTSNLGAAVTLVNGVASVTTNTLVGAGAHSITALYSGDGNNFAGTSSALNEIVNATLAANDGDVPLPLWALWLLGATFLALQQRQRTR